MRDAAVITITLILVFLLLGYTYNLVSPYLIKLGVIEKSDKRAVLAPDGGIFRSEDFGRTWAQANKTTDGGELEKSDVFEIKFSPKDARMIYAATAKGLFVSQDSANTWRNILDAKIVFSDEAIVAFALDQKNPQRMYLAAFEVNKRSRILKTKGVGFYEVYSTAAAENKITGLWVDSFDPSVIYAGTTQGLLLVSRDFGESWGIVHEFTGPVGELEMLPSDTRVILVAAGGSIFKSPNQGNTFKQIWQEGGIGATSTLINDLSIDPHDETVIYAATSRGLFRSSDSGLSFTQLKFPIAAEAANVATVYAAREKKNLLLLGINSDIYKSEDAGVSWQIQQLNSSRKVSVVKIKPGDLQTIFAGVKQ